MLSVDPPPRCYKCSSATSAVCTGPDLSFSDVFCTSSCRVRCIFYREKQGAEAPACSRSWVRCRSDLRWIYCPVRSIVCGRQNYVIATNVNDRDVQLHFCRYVTHVRPYSCQKCVLCEGQWRCLEKCSPHNPVMWRGRATYTAWRGSY